jgi:hypothetical protein
VVGGHVAPRTARVTVCPSPRPFTHVAAHVDVIGHHGGHLPTISGGHLRPIAGGHLPPLASEVGRGAVGAPRWQAAARVCVAVGASTVSNKSLTDSCWCLLTATGIGVEGGMLLTGTLPLHNLLTVTTDY